MPDRFHSRHTHEEVFNAVVFGKKLWLLMDAKEKIQDTDKFYTSISWLVHSRGAAKKNLLRCIVSAGEILYLPAEWHHATLNLGDTIARSTKAIRRVSDNPKRSAYLDWNADAVTRELQKIGHDARAGISPHSMGGLLKTLSQADFLRSICLFPHVFHTYQKTLLQMREIMPLLAWETTSLAAQYSVAFAEMIGQLETFIACSSPTFLDGEPMPEICYVHGAEIGSCRDGQYSLS